MVQTVKQMKGLICLRVETGVKVEVLPRLFNLSYSVSRLKIQSDGFESTIQTCVRPSRARKVSESESIRASAVALFHPPASHEHLHDEQSGLVVNNLTKNPSATQQRAHQKALPGNDPSRIWLRAITVSSNALLRCYWGVQTPIFASCLQQLGRLLL